MASVNGSVFCIRLVHNWQRVIWRAWSVRFMALAAMLTGLEAAFLMVGSYLPVDATVLAVVTFLLVTAAFVSRLIAQKGINTK